MLSELEDKALAVYQAIITRHGKLAAELHPADMAPAHCRLSAEEWAKLHARRDARPSLGNDSVSIVRSLRDERS